MKNNILFLCCAYSEDKKDEYLSRSRKGYQFAAQKFQEALLSGFHDNGVEPFVLSLPSLSTFPLGYKRPMVKTVDFIYNNKSVGKSLGFLNLPFFNKNCSRKLINAAQKWVRSKEGKKIIIVYGVHSHLLASAVRIKHDNDNVLICLVAPDLPQYMACNRVYKMLGLQRRDIAKIESLLPFVDSSVVLAKPMIKELHLLEKPYVVIEGVYDNSGNTTTLKEIKKEKIILYTGGLAMRYGLGDLVDAFMKIKNPSYRLLLCGRGDAVPYIIKSSQLDSRIDYKGMLPAEKINTLQKTAAVLVNPRHSSEEFTKYSFPSKTMEYLASGTPTIMSHLECIPTEYDDYLFYFEDETAEGMAKKIVEVCEKAPEELQEIGSRASKFICEEKNAKNQVQKIIKMLETL